MTIHGSTQLRDHTESVPSGPLTRHDGEAVRESPARTFSISNAACSTHSEQLEWVPDRERPLVPTVMARLCRRCLGRQQCLLWALGGQEQGYWAATTTADREKMIALGQTSVHTADWLQEMTRRNAVDGALHPEGQGSYYWYRRRGCRCSECQSANSVARARERERTKSRQKATEAAFTLISPVRHSLPPPGSANP